LNSEDGTPFISILHDVWTKNNSEILGVSIGFIDPVSFGAVQLAVGLLEITTKDSKKMVDHVNKILDRLEITGSDVWRGISDNTNAAKKVGRTVAMNRSQTIVNLHVLCTHQI
jgi:hypothetical protein